MMFIGQKNSFILVTSLCVVAAFIYYHAPHRTAANLCLYELSVLPY